MVILKSPAKINWGLWILGRRPDGYHEIFTPIQKIGLFDLIEIEKSNSLTVQTSNNIPQKENFVYKGLKKFEEVTGIPQRWKIFIKKQIPIGGGLGGGSSNLATVLRWVNNYWNKPLNFEELKNLVSAISSDAPAFLGEGTAIAEGRGEKVEFWDIPTFKGVKITLLIPQNIISPTGEIYRRVIPKMYSPREEIETIKEVIKAGDLKRLLELIKNPLGEIFLSLHPELKEAIDFIQKKCYKKIFVSGSGSSLYTVGSLECENWVDRLKKRFKIISLETL
ncbi:MAG: 4-(cytidine 5'-diphospho)-2-C-methyl-D-erythritol kinase [Aquificota bacterium]|jgi:4-diphosphocytidyl-2-C-methyl-D-erythritol kinase